MADELTPGEVQEMETLQREMRHDNDRDGYWNNQSKQHRYTELLGRQLAAQEERSVESADFSRETMERLWKLPTEERAKEIERLASLQPEENKATAPADDNQRLARMLMIEPSDVPNIDRNWKAISAEIDGRDRDWIQAEFDGLSEDLKRDVMRALASPSKYAEIEAGLTPRLKSELRAFYDSITHDALKAIGRIFA